MEFDVYSVWCGLYIVYFLGCRVYFCFDWSVLVSVVVYCDFGFDDVINVLFEVDCWEREGNGFVFGCLNGYVIINILYGYVWVFERGEYVWCIVWGKGSVVWLCWKKSIEDIIVFC